MGSHKWHGKRSAEVRCQQIKPTYVMFFSQIVKEHPSVPAKLKKKEEKESAPVVKGL